MTGPQPLPKRVLHTVRPSAASFNLQYPHVFLRSSNRCLRILPRPPATSVPSSIFPSIMYFRRQFLLFTVCRIFLSSFTPCNTSSFLTRLVQLIFSIFLTFQNFPRTRWFKYDRDDLCVSKSQFVPVIFEPPCISDLLSEVSTFHTKTLPQL